MSRTKRVLLSFLPVALMSVGASMVYPPAGLILLGGVWWVETRFGK